MSLEQTIADTIELADKLGNGNRILLVGHSSGSLDVMLNDRLIIDLFTSVPRLDVPVFLLTGRHDYNTVWSLVEEWSQHLQAADRTDYPLIR